MRTLRLTAEQYAAHQGRRANKFNARKKMVSGIEFDSTKEAERYQLLQMEMSAEKIRNLKLQVPLHVDINGEHVFTYLCDFVYERPTHWSTAEGVKLWRHVYEDVKGYRKGAAYQLFRLKKAVIKAALGIEIEEV